VDSEVTYLLLNCASQISKKEKFLRLLQMWHVSVLSILGYEVKVEGVDKRVRTSGRLQVCKNFNEKKLKEE